MCVLITWAMLLVVIALLIVLMKKIPRPGNASLVPSVIQTFFVPLPGLPPYSSL